MHWFADLKESVEAGTPEYDRACALRTQLTYILASDTAVDHSAALMRVPGTHNYKCTPPALCQVIEPGAPTDLTDIEAFLDLYQRPLFEKKARANGHDVPPPDSGPRAPLDVSGALASMRFEGGENGINKTQWRVVGALLSRGLGSDIIIEDVLTATQKATEGDERCKDWDWNAERVAIRDMCCRTLAKKPDLAYLLPSDLLTKWEDAALEGKTPKLILRNDTGWQVRGYDQKTEGEESAAATTSGSKKTKGPFVIKPFAYFDPALLPQREWLYGRHYQRRTVSCTTAPGGFGKTTLDMIEGVAMTTCRDLLGEQPSERLRVWLHNGEDNLIELNRRIAAICQHHKIDMRQLEGWLFLTSGSEFPLKVATGFSELRIDGKLVDRIAEQIAENKIDVAILDPLITLHGVSEGDNVRMDTVIRLFSGIADAENCAIELSHHMRKMPAGVSADYTAADIRGATAIFDAVRSARVLNRMADKEGAELGLPSSSGRGICALIRPKGITARPQRHRGGSLRTSSCPTAMTLASSYLGITQGRGCRRPRLLR